MLKPEEIQAGKWYLIKFEGELEIVLTRLAGRFKTQLVGWMSDCLIPVKLEEVIWIKELDLKKLEEEG